MDLWNLSPTILFVMLLSKNPGQITQYIKENINNNIDKQAISITSDIWFDRDKGNSYMNWEIFT